MSHAIFISNPNSSFDNQPGELYHFPNRNYLSTVQKTVGDWVIFYQSRRSGRPGYMAVQKVAAVRPDPRDPTSSYAILDPASRLDFEQYVPRLRPDGLPFETGLPLSRGKNSSAVRLVSEADFSAILSAGLEALPEADSLPRLGPLPQGNPYGDLTGISNDPLPFGPAPLRPQILSRRDFRDRVFARIVKRAYQGRCAMSGLALRNGGGRPEVEAAHIVPVESRGPDTLQNGIALSGTVHWMFDRGLVSVDDEARILVASDPEVAAMANRLLLPERRLLLPADPALRPHRAYLAWHREHRFKG